MGTPRHMLAWMAVVAVLVAIGCGLAIPQLRDVFLQAAPLNAGLLALLALGLVLDFWHVARLDSALSWVDRVSRGFSERKPPQVVAGLARVVAGREREGFTVSALSMSALLEGVRVRLREAADLPRLLVRLIGTLALAGAAWGMLNEGASAALSVLFFGLAAAAALGVFNTLVRQAQKSLERELEEFLASRAELPSTVLGGETTLPGYLEGLLKQSAESLQELQRMMVRSEEERLGMQNALGLLTERLTELSDHMRAEHKVLVTLSRSHNQLQPVIADLAAEIAGAAAASEETRGRLRNLDASVARLVDEVSAARAQTPELVRKELKMLTQVLAPAALRKAG